MISRPTSAQKPSKVHPGSERDVRPPEPHEALQLRATAASVGCMPRIAVRLLVALATSAIALWVASLLLDNMSITATGLITATILFTILTVLLAPVVEAMLEKYAAWANIAAGAIVSFLALLITTLLSDNLTIEGVGTWVIATVLVWLASVVTALVLARLFRQHLRAGETGS